MRKHHKNIQRKVQTNFELTKHVGERAYERFNLSLDRVQEIVQRSKTVNLQNNWNFGEAIAKRAFGMANDPTCTCYLRVNTFFDAVFVIDQHDNAVVTTYKLSEAKTYQQYMQDGF